MNTMRDRRSSPGGACLNRRVEHVMHAVDRHRQWFLLQVQNPLNAQEILSAPLPQHL